MKTGHVRGRREHGVIVIKGAISSNSRSPPSANPYPYILPTQTKVHQHQRTVNPTSCRTQTLFVLLLQPQIPPHPRGSSLTCRLPQHSRPPPTATPSVFHCNPIRVPLHLHHIPCDNQTSRPRARRGQKRERLVHLCIHSPRSRRGCGQQETTASRAQGIPPFTPHYHQ